MELRLYQYVIEKGYSSSMNNTKWKELILVLTGNCDFEPRVNIKYLLEEKNNGFYSVWWEEVEREGFEYIEYIKINPIKEIYIGRLVQNKKEDHSLVLREGLERYAIPYEIHENLFVIRGYVKSKKLR